MHAISQVSYSWVNCIISFAWYYMGYWYFCCQSKDNIFPVALYNLQFTAGNVECFDFVFKYLFVSQGCVHSHISCSQAQSSKFQTMIVSFYI